MSYGSVVAATAVAVLVAGAWTARPDRGTRGIQAAGWLQGCWELKAPNRTTEEHWIRPAGGTMLGLSRTVVRAGERDSTTEYEFLRLFARDGKLVYAAHPSGQSATEFTESEQGDGSIVFANPAHDFPQRIIYRRRGADSLHARIEGTMGGQSRGMDFRYRRVACE